MKLSFELLIMIFSTHRIHRKTNIEHIGMITKSYLNNLTYQIIGSAIEVHKLTGPGLLESVYHKCRMRELYSETLKKNNFYVNLYYPKCSMW